jgi:hypothetical protein
MSAESGRRQAGARSQTVLAPDHDHVHGRLGFFGVGVGHHEHHTVRDGAKRRRSTSRGRLVAELFVLLGKVAAESAAVTLAATTIVQTDPLAPVPTAVRSG